MNDNVNQVQAAPVGDTPTQVDIEDLMGKIDGLTQQRNSAYDDAANVYARLKKLTNMFNNLLTAFNTLKAKYEPEAVGVNANVSGTQETPVDNSASTDNQEQAAE